MSWKIAKAAIDDFIRHGKLSEKPSETEMPVMMEDWFTEDIIRNRTELRQNFHIGFYGGEPLLNFPLIKKCTEYALEKMKGKDLTFGISTNGYLLKGEVADFLGTNRFVIRVSIDGPAAIHDSQRQTVNGSPTWTVVIENIRAFSAKYPNLIPSLGATWGPTVNVDKAFEALATAPWIAPLQSVSATLSEEPYPGYNKAVAGVEDFPGREELRQRHIKNVMSGRLSLIPEDREVQLHRSMYISIFRRLHSYRWVCAVARRGSGSMMPSGPCMPGNAKVFVSVDGTYRLCEKIPEIQGYVFGNVFTGIDNEKAYGILKEFVDYTREQCKNCWCLPICTTGCYVSVCSSLGHREKVTKEKKEQSCECSRKSAHALIVNYCRILEKSPEAFDFYKLY